MLPAPKSDRISLADVLPSCLSALGGSENRLGLGRVSNAVVLLVDGLGAAALKSRAGHARTLAGAPGAVVIESGFPTTTAAALGSLTTGVSPGQHGLVGFMALDEANDRVVNQLSGWDEKIDPASWQRAATVFEAAAAQGYRAFAIGAERYRTSGFTKAVLRGAQYLAGESVDDRFSAALEQMNTPGAPSLFYLYVPELDIAAHASGWESTEWTDRLEAVDAALREFLRHLRPTDGVLATADHGILDIPPHAHAFVDAVPGLLDGVRFIAGDPRCLQLHFERELPQQEREGLIRRWREAESSRAWVATREEAIAANWFGEVSAEVAPRIGDLLVAARKAIAYYDGRATSTHGQAMVGQHGSWSPEELRVPLLRFGAFAL